MPRKNNPKGGSNPIAVLARKREGKAVTLRLEGLTLQQIADRLGYISRESARSAVLRGMVRLGSPENAEELRKQEVAKTYEIEQEAWEQWHRSTEDAVSVSVRQTIKGDETTTTRVGQCGNPALLDKVLKAMERRAKLLGLDAPEQLNIDGGLRVHGQNPLEVLEAAVIRLKQQNAGD